MGLIFFLAIWHERARNQTLVSLYLVLLVYTVCIYFYVPFSRFLCNWFLSNWLQFDLV